MSESQGGITETVQEQASQAKEKGMETVSEQLDRRTTDAGKQAKTLADALRRTGRQMEAEGSGSGMTRMTSAVADRVERAGGYLERASGNEMLDDVEQRYPARHYVLIDDKLRILTAIKHAWGDRVTTVFPRQGHYALDPKVVAMYPAADVSVDHIAELLDGRLQRMREEERIGLAAGARLAVVVALRRQQGEEARGVGPRRQVGVADHALGHALSV